MPTFGQYETAQRLFLSGVSGIYALKSDDKKIIKVLHPPVGIWSDDRIQEEIDAFRLRAKTQKKVAAASRNWAPILDVAAIRDSASTQAEADAGTSDVQGGSRVDSVTGETEGRPVASGAFAVMDRYERSLQSLLDGRITIHNADLRAIFTGIIQGLLDLKKFAARPHGALKPSNILLANSANLPAATIHLSDPAPDGVLTAKSADKDLADVARLLYHLVNRRAYDEGTIGRNKDWNALGPNGEDWRALCNHFLDPQAPAEERDLEKILPRIATWTKKPARSKTPLIAAAVMLVLVGGGVGAYLHFRPKPVKFDSTVWQDEALNYFGWYDTFSEDVTKGAYHDQFNGTPATQPGARPFPLLAPLINKDKANPLNIAALRGHTLDQDSDWENFILNANDAVRTPPGPQATLDAKKQIDAVAAALKSWPVRVQIDGAAERFGALGWKNASDKLKDIALSALPPEISEPANPAQADDDFHERFKKAQEARSRKTSLAAAIALADATVPTVDSIDKHWNGITNQLAALHAGGEIPLLKKLPDFAKSVPNAPPSPGPDEKPTGDVLKDLDNSLTRVDKLLATLTAALNNSREQIVFSELAKDPLAADSVTPSIAAFEALAAAVPGYFKLKTDPRDAVLADWKTRQVSIKSDVDDFLSDPEALKVEGSQQHRDDLRNRQAQLEKILQNAGTPLAIAKNSAEISTAAQQNTAAILKLFNDAEEWAGPFKTDPVAYVQARHDEVPKSTLKSPAVLARWKSDHAAYLAKVESARDNLHNFKYRQSVDAKFDRLAKIYDALDKAIPAAVPGLSDYPGTGWQRDIATRLTTVWRENALKDIIALVPPPTDDVPDVLSSTFTTPRDRRLAEYDTACKAALSLISDYTSIATSLNQLQLLSTEAPPGQYWADLYRNGTGNAARKSLLSDSVIAQSVAPITGRAETLLAAQAKSDYAALLQDAQSPVPEIALSAWRKLGTIAISGEDVPALKNEDAAETSLLGRIQALAGLAPARAAALKKEITDARPARWRTWAKLATSNDNLALAVKSASDWGVSITLQSDRDLYFYQRLFQLRAAYQAAPADEQALGTPAKTFIAAMADPALADIANTDALKGMLADLGKALDKKQSAAAAAKQGPQWAGWIPQPVTGDQVRIFKSPDGAFSLEFQKLTVNESSGQSIVMYLATTETPVGLFVDVMNKHLAAPGASIDEINNDKQSSGHWFDVPATRADDNFYKKGIRSWCLIDGKFDLNPKWIDVDGAGFPPALGGKAYPDAAQPAPPATNDPVQLVSPWASMFAANLLGCRLPTPAEWKEAYHQFEEADNLPKNVWNLRGRGTGPASWRTQNDYAATTQNRNLLDGNIFLADPANERKLQDQPWTFEDLLKVAPKRFQGAGEYPSNTLWFQHVDQETSPAASAGAPKSPMHHLVGNVAEFVFDGTDAVKAVENFNPTTAAVDAAVAASPQKLFVIGGSSLSTPGVSFLQEQSMNMLAKSTRTGFSDVGFRLAYTEPQETVAGVLRRIFDPTKALPGPRKK